MLFEPIRHKIQKNKKTRKYGEYSMEGLVGFEPTIRELQSHALPLGYRPKKKNLVN